ncbi:hypothetical protein HID58_032964 [Brassica napus]|uniref:Uncharacterized protein n=1 Tax=Brassica napus TaxID=3708 RepID=A0ABQ8BXX8_BRANA|nr:hypothetical protein HID58_032964 [Brassica napus]
MSCCTWLFCDYFSQTISCWHKMAYRNKNSPKRRPW